jgi:hypothetical protein
MIKANEGKVQTLLEYFNFLARHLKPCCSLVELEHDKE